MTMQCRLIKSSNVEASNQPELASALFVSARKGLAAFFTAVNKLFGAEQARKSAIHWIEELESMDWLGDKSRPAPSGRRSPLWTF
jgi:hypothetical protein